MTAILLIIIFILFCSILEDMIESGVLQIILILVGIFIFIGIIWAKANKKRSELEYEEKLKESGVPDKCATVKGYYIWRENEAIHLFPVFTAGESYEQTIIPLDCILYYYQEGENSLQTDDQATIMLFYEKYYGMLIIQTLNIISAKPN